MDGKGLNNERCKARISIPLLLNLLGLDVDKVHIRHVEMDYEHYNSNTLTVYFYGGEESLPEVQEWVVVPECFIVSHTDIIDGQKVIKSHFEEMKK